MVEEEDTVDKDFDEEERPDDEVHVADVDGRRKRKTVNFETTIK